MTDTANTRLLELETKVMFQQETIDKLNDVVTSQWQEIDRLKKILNRLDDQLYALETQIDTPKGAEPPPPHY